MTTQVKRQTKGMTVRVVNDVPPRRSAPARLLGMVMLAVVVLLTTSCSALPGGLGGGKMEVTAYFEDSAGLFVGNDVGILGVVVGKITSIEPDGEQVKVTMEIDDDYDVPADAGAVVVARSVATDRYVELTPVYKKGPKLEDGAEIPIAQTRTPVDFDQLLAALNEFSTGIAGSKTAKDAIANFINKGAGALEGNGPLVNQTIHALQEGVNGLHSQRDNVASTLKSLDVLLAAISQNESTARTFIHQVSEASDLLADERENFRSALRALNDAVTVVAEFAVDNRQQIVEALGGSTKVVKTIMAKQDQLTEILRVMPLALQNLQRARRGDRVAVTADPIALLPLGGVLNQICDQLPPAICQLIGTDPLGGN
ncbi:MCE family protein [Nocardioides humilatus]|uniref:MCE family protein n=1 Tax=Nocardioides humilatus TaxID=2607660 RepID=A0A5B1L9A8_9ACTN|nr:MlaD family protein [Nocardioides humilatus]KAA1416360.1 MCE family protein [Nocardioides humilatus]